MKSINLDNLEFDINYITNKDEFTCTNHFVEGCLI